jgi:hypothetical protein
MRLRAPQKQYVELAWQVTFRRQLQMSLRGPLREHAQVECWLRAMASRGTKRWSNA